jgi:type IV pilus assembly protein PilB
MKKKSKLGEILVKNNIILRKQLEEALKIQEKYPEKRIGEILIELKHLTDEELLNALSLQFGIPVVDLSNYEIREDIIKILPQDMIKKYKVIPINRFGNTLILAVDDPTDISAIDDIKFYTGYNIDIVIASTSAIRETIDKILDNVSAIEQVEKNFQLDDVEFEEIPDDDETDVNILETETKQGPVVKLVNYILTEAVKKKVSDIHIEQYEKSFRVRYRIDGVLTEFMKLPLKLRSAIISRIKIMSHLNIAERRVPQDGRIKLKYGKNKEIDFRVSTLPTLFGEKVVLRLLDKSNLNLDLKVLGFEKRELELFHQAISKPYGMILVTGPTGSGKTTTLYSALSELNKVDVNISTAEDPVEYNLEGINQVQIRENVGLTFAAALRSFLRQDPDIILVGEMRDLETAEIGVKAALTGHLVLSTLHTNDAPGTVTRLVDMGVEPFLISSSLLLVVAQRLARKICQNCKKEYKVDKSVLLRYGVKEEELDSFKVYKGEGCEICNSTGYKGRVALYEVMSISDDLKELITKGATTQEIKEQANREGMKNLREVGLMKVKQGITTLEEVSRVTIQ